MGQKSSCFGAGAMQWLTFLTIATFRAPAAPGFALCLMFGMSSAAAVGFQASLLAASALFDVQVRAPPLMISKTQMQSICATSLGFGRVPNCCFARLQVLLRSVPLSAAGSAGFGLASAWMVWLFVGWMGRERSVNEKARWRRGGAEVAAPTVREQNSEGE